VFFGYLGDLEPLKVRTVPEFPEGMIVGLFSTDIAKRRGGRFIGCMKGEKNDFFETHKEVIRITNSSSLSNTTIILECRR
jgi:ADP-dependent phosphofructokinase/glucokinase